MDEDKFKNIIIFLAIALGLFFVFLTISNSDTTDEIGEEDLSQDTYSERTPSIEVSKPEIIKYEESGNNMTVRLEKNGGVYEIPIIINNTIHLRFIFDSGAAEVSISPDVALVLIKSGTMNEKDRLEDKRYQYASGVIEVLPSYNLKSLTIGDKTVYNVQCSISNNLEAPLLLGQSALEKFGKFTFDYARGELIFNK